jgi:hypothetical protein
MIKQEEPILNLKEKMREKLDEQNLIDLKAIMNTEHGRRVFSYLIQNCGYKDSQPLGNSKDFFNSGRRSVAVELIAACDALGMYGPDRMIGVDLRLQAEREYIVHQWNVMQNIIKGGEKK